MSSVLITGGAGFIGCRLGRQLVAAGHDVTAIDNLHPQVHVGAGRPADLADEVTLLPLDVSEPASWDTALKLTQPEIIVHLAAETGTGQSLTEATRHGSVNVVGTTAMLDALHRHGLQPDQFLLASSRAVYGEGAWSSDGGVFYPPPRSHEQLEASAWDPMAPDGSPARPVAQAAAAIEPRPTNVYAATKLAQEHILSAWCTAFGVGLTVLRLQNVFGAGQSLANSYTGVLTYFAREAVAGKQIHVFEDGEIIRDFVHVDDVVAAMTASIARPTDGMRLADIGSGQPLTIHDAAVTIAGICAAPPPVVTGEFRDGDVRAAWADITLARELVGYEPAVTFADGIEGLVRFATGHRVEETGR